jgi:hypothetical protein
MIQLEKQKKKVPSLINRIRTRGERAKGIFLLRVVLCTTNQPLMENGSLSPYKSATISAAWD